MEKFVTWTVQIGVAGTLALVASLGTAHGLSPLLAGMAGGVVIASGIGLGMRTPPEPVQVQEARRALAQRDVVRTSTSTFEG